MSDTSTNNLSTIDDYLDWNNLINNCEKLDLSALDKTNAKVALKFLSKELGNDFLRNGFASQHPILGNYIFNQAPWTRKWLTWFANSLKEIKDQDNYQNLLKRLKDSDKYKEALSVFKIAVKLSLSGFSISIDPKISKSERTKIPDLKIINNENGEELFVEVSIQGRSIIAKEASMTSEKINDLFWKYLPQLMYSGIVHKTLSETHLHSVLIKINRTIDKVLSENAFHELIIDGVLEIGIAPINEKESLENWSANRGLQIGEFKGPPYYINEIQRLRGKIDSEQRQLPLEFPNIVVIYNNNLFLMNNNIIQIINELEEDVYRFPHLLFAVISSEYILAKRENLVRMKDQHVYLVKPTEYLHTEEDIILFNQFCKHKISPSTVTKIYSSFRNF